MKIMTISDAPNLFSGMARVHRNIIDAFVEDGHEVLPCGWFAYTTEQMNKFAKGEPPTPLHYDSNGKQVRFYCVPKSGGNKPMLTIYDAAELFKPDWIVTLGDAWDFWYMGPIKSKLDFSFKWLAYVNVENDLSPRHAAVLKYADAVMVPSKYGVGVLGQHGINAVFNQYGVDHVFRRMSNDERERLREKRGISKDHVRFICVAQNTTRKNIPAIFWAAKELYPMRDKFKIYLHTNVSATDPQEAFSFSLREIEEKMGVTGIFSYPSSASVFSSPSDELMAEEYNASDYLLMPSIAEGFALPVVEAMACGLPALTNDTSAMTEHVSSEASEGWHERGYLCSYGLHVSPPAVFARLINSSSLAHGMAEAIQNRGSSWMEGKRVACEEYAKGLSWRGAKEKVCGLIRSFDGRPPVVPVEEL